MTDVVFIEEEEEEEKELWIAFGSRASSGLDYVAPPPPPPPSASPFRASGWVEWPRHRRILCCVWLCRRWASFVTSTGKAHDNSRRRRRQTVRVGRLAQAIDRHTHTRATRAACRLSASMCNGVDSWPYCVRVREGGMLLASRRKEGRKRKGEIKNLERLLLLLCTHTHGRVRPGDESQANNASLICQFSFFLLFLFSAVQHPEGGWLCRHGPGAIATLDTFRCCLVRCEMKWRRELYDDDDFISRYVPFSFAIWWMNWWHGVIQRVWDDFWLITIDSD